MFPVELPKIFFSRQIRKMADLETIVEMRKTLATMNTNLTPYSGKIEHQRYLENLQHYKKILNTYITKSNQELDDCIEKSYKIVRSFQINDINKIKHQILNGTSG